ncbi:hypothetical protein BCR41DRAFT_363064 [Lobosporangium transversale]|uniref:Secreted protein n=1 Tax=Lobosporangium transversale TaxID=64571 RepID=A0A1Y2G8J1_9FUNG|nr:hypothetical protein BCR41DRAFT_363064 [Lobosporangium transversale]ORZ04226.1 hypothetical protein BCR41DRAFT_363064 [Lobosporangium transversale]|eukprot:XP_021876440.1 hypothetical protein BCR41DRAFT_363064 [Lobosporangium transversale]
MGFVRVSFRLVSLACLFMNVNSCVSITCIFVYECLVSLPCAIKKKWALGAGMEIILICIYGVHLPKCLSAPYTHIRVLRIHRKPDTL